MKSDSSSGGNFYQLLVSQFNFEDKIRKKNIIFLNSCKIMLIQTKILKWIMVENFTQKFIQAASN